MSHASAGSARLAFDVEGEGADVLLVHAGVTDRRSWAPLRAALGGRVRTIAYDQRGFGETTSEPEPHSAVDDAVAVLDAAGAERAVVVGASMGGRRSIDLTLAHPDRVRALVLIGAGLRGGPVEDPKGFGEDVQSLYRAYEAAEAAADLDELNRIEAHAWLDGWSAPEGRVQGPVRDLFLEMNAEALAAPDPGEDGSRAAWNEIGAIEVPTLVLVGDLDDLSRSAADHLAAGIPGATYELLEGTAHLPHLEGHARTLEFVAELLFALI